ncbi:MAG: hypothetical protein AAGC56_09350 [Pseudomonadota bacterium]
MKIFALAFAGLLITPEAPYDPADRTNPDYLEGLAGGGARYQRCVAVVSEDPEGARAVALEWTQAGGGPPATHCLALADLARGYPKLAGARLALLAEDGRAGDVLVRARLLEQAALAFLEADEDAQALDAIKNAIAMAPNAGEIRLTAGVVNAANENWEAVVKSVTAAEETGVVSLDGYLARTRAYLALAKARQAAEDVVNALRIDPFNVDALVLRGEILQAGVDVAASYRRRGAEPPADPDVPDPPSAPAQTPR